MQAEGRRVRNIVFMGMGEPFHNEAAVYEAVAALLSPEMFHHPPGRILISTVGIPDAMVRCARRFPDVNLALSLHSVRQDVREQLIPLAAKYSLDDLRAAVAKVNQIQNNTVMIEYLMLAGVNDSADDARELAEWLTGLNAHVNLIPYNPIETAPHLRTTERPGARRLRRDPPRRRLHHDDPLLARRRHRRRLRPARAARESRHRRLHADGMPHDLSEPARR